MNPVEQIRYRCQRAGVVLKTDGQVVTFSAPPGAMSPELMADLKAIKSLIIFDLLIWPFQLPEVEYDGSAYFVRNPVPMAALVLWLAQRKGFPELSARTSSPDRWRRFCDRADQSELMTIGCELEDLPDVIATECAA